MPNQKQSSLNTRIVFQKKNYFRLESLFRIYSLKTAAFSTCHTSFLFSFPLPFVCNVLCCRVLFLLLLRYFRIRRWSRRLIIIFLFCFYILVVIAFFCISVKQLLWDIVLVYCKRKLMGWNGKYNIVLSFDSVGNNCAIFYSFNVLKCPCLSSPSQFNSAF